MLAVDCCLQESIPAELTALLAQLDAKHEPYYYGVMFGLETARERPMQSVEGIVAAAAPESAAAPRSLGSQ